MHAPRLAKRLMVQRRELAVPIVAAEPLMNLLDGAESGPSSGRARLTSSSGSAN
jgi:hypothetical protein